MKIIKKYKKVFICVAIAATILAIIPTIGIYIFSSMSIDVTNNDSEKVIKQKVDSYFSDGGFETDIENALRKNPTGDFNVYTHGPNSEKFNELEKMADIIAPELLELSRLDPSKKYNIKVYSDYYEGISKVTTEELISKDIVGTLELYMIYEDSFMNGGSKRDMKIHFIQNNKIIETIEYYCPTNYNESAYTLDADLNINESIPIMSFTRGKKVNGKYKTYSPDLHKSKKEIEKSIQNNLSKNEKMVILRLEINEI